MLAMADVLPDEPRASGGLARMLGVLGGGRRAVRALVAGIAGTGGFVASLVLDWQSVTMNLNGSNIFGQSGDQSFTVGLRLASYAVVYLIGMLGLIAVLGAVLTRPDLAARLRVGTAGFGVGLTGVIVAIGFQIQDTVFGRMFFGFTDVFVGPVPPEMQEQIDATVFGYQPGTYLAVGAVLALVTGVWLAAGPVRAEPVVHAPLASPVPATAPAAAPVSPSPVGPPGLPPDRLSAGAGWPSQVGFADGLSVSSSDAIDPGSQSDILRG